MAFLAQLLIKLQEVIKGKATMLIIDFFLIKECRVIFSGVI